MKSAHTFLAFFRFASIVVAVIILLNTLPRTGFSEFEACVLAALVAIVSTLFYIMRDLARIAEKQK